jgi:hypothetical protein
VGHYDVSTFDLDTKSRICEGLSNDPLHFERFFLLFRHTKLHPGTTSAASGSTAAAAGLAATTVPIL